MFVTKLGEVYYSRMTCFGYGVNCVQFLCQLPERNHHTYLLRNSMVSARARPQKGKLATGFLKRKEILIMMCLHSKMNDWKGEVNNMVVIDRDLTGYMPGRPNTKAFSCYILKEKIKITAISRKLDIKYVGCENNPIHWYCHFYSHML